MYMMMASWQRKSILIGVLCLVGWWSTALPAEAQRFFLPIELAQGVLLPDGSPKPYMASVRAHGLVALSEAFRVGPSVALAYANPKASFQAGGRAQVRLKAFTIKGVFTVAQVDLAVEALWGTEDRNPLGGALVFGINRVVHLSLRGGYDLGQEAAYLGTSIGTDLTFLFGGRPTAGTPNPIPAPPFEGCPALIYTEARIRAQAAFAADTALRDRTQAFLRDGLQVLRFRDSRNLAAAKGVLNAANLEPLAEQIDPTLGRMTNRAECQGMDLDTRTTRNALLSAWDRAVVLTGGR